MACSRHRKFFLSAGLALFTTAGCQAPSSRPVPRPVAPAPARAQEAAPEMPLGPDAIVAKATAFHQSTVYQERYPSFRGCSFLSESGEYVVSFTDTSASKGIKYYLDSRGRFRDFLLVNHWY